MSEIQGRHTHVRVISYGEEKKTMKVMPFLMEKSCGKKGRPRRPVSRSQHLEQKRSLQWKVQRK